jgi:hypothetical protein
MPVAGGGETLAGAPNWSVPVGHGGTVPHQTTLVKVRWRRSYDGVSSETIRYRSPR